MISITKKVSVLIAFLSSSILLPGSASAQQTCVVKGNTLSDARDRYSAQCSLPRLDCDPFGSEWICASFRMTSPIPPALTVPSSTPVTEPAENIQTPVVNTPTVSPPTTDESDSGQADSDEVQTVVSQPRQICVTTSSDSDGDGYGWENNASCVVQADTTTGSNTPGSNTPGNTSSQPACLSNATDPDGDGYGWENSRTCVVTAATTVVNIRTPVAVNTPSVRPTCVMPGSDPDGDGYGWENNRSCVGPVLSDISVLQGSPAVTEADITDLILVSGQSNALGYASAYDAQLDAPNQRVFAFTNNGWRVANLNQIWDLNWHPRNYPDTDPSNNFALHFGKTLAYRQEDRVVGFILATAPGRKISHWSTDGEFYQTVQTKVLDAINQLPHKSAIDGILWHQGESDNQDVQSYTDAIYSLINQWRSEPWVDSDAPFICGETKFPAVNRRLNGLNNDNDPNTACIEAQSLATLDGVHFDAEALRTMGSRYAEAYLQMKP